MLKSRVIIQDYWRPIIEGHGQRRTSDWILKSICEEYGVKQLTPDTLIKLYRAEPAFFFIHILNIIPWTNELHPYSDQLAILEAVRVHDRTAVRSGHKVSKSNTLSGVALWWYVTRPKARVPITSASYAQVRKIIWYEVRSMYYGAQTRGIDIGGEFFEDPQSGLRMNDGREVFGFSTKEAERAAGISGPNIFYLVDEGSGVEEKIFEPIEGNRAGGAKMAMFGNPTKTSGTFYNAFHSKRQFWHTIHVSSEFTPNVQAGRKIIPGLATPEWIEEKKAEWGDDSPLFHVRIKGNFPPQGPNAVIPISLVEDARSRYRMWEEAGLPIIGTLGIGVDPAYYGDDEMVIYPVADNIALPPVVKYQCTAEDIADEVVEVVKRFAGRVEEIRINVDSKGEGKAAFELLAYKYSELLRNYNAYVVPIDVAEVSDYPDLYWNKRTQLAFGIKDWLEKGGSIPDDPKLEAELVSVSYEMSPKGQYKLPLKEKERQILGRSPDRRNALELAIYRGKTYNIEYRSSGTRETAGGAITNYLGYG